MTQDEIIRMAREAGFKLGTSWYGGVSMLERFFNLAFAAGAAHEREKEIKRVAEGHGWTQAHWTAYEESIVAAEREACAKVVLDDALALTFQTFGQYRTALAAAIRARGE